jgi:hypothetical protein
MMEMLDFILTAGLLFWTAYACADLLWTWIGWRR